MKEVSSTLQLNQRDLDYSYSWNNKQFTFAHHECPTGERGGEEHRDMEGEEVRNIQSHHRSAPLTPNHLDLSRGLNKLEAMELP